MQIPLIAAVGYGSSLLSAFDDALRACGVLNYYLIPLSSVIPPATTSCLWSDTSQALTSAAIVATSSSGKRQEEEA